MSSLKFHLTTWPDFAPNGASPQHWARAYGQGDTREVFLTLAWQRAWWEAFGRGQLLVVVAERAESPVAIAPLFADQGMIFFVGSGGSDYLDFVGDISDPQVLDGLLQLAREAVQDFLGFRFYHVPDESRTGGLLASAAERMELAIFDEGSLPAPALDLAKDPAAGQAASEKGSLVRHERGFRRDGKLEVEHLLEPASVLPHLDGFFAQHIARWAVTPYPSLFTDGAHREFYRRLTTRAGEAGFLRFTRLVWNDHPIAYHYGFCHRGSFLWYKPSFDIALRKRSPGEVLLRQLIIEGMREGAHTFDFGLGDEAFKRRFANRTRIVRTWGLYPPEVLRSKTVRGRTT